MPLVTWNYKNSVSVLKYFIISLSINRRHKRHIKVRVLVILQTPHQSEVSCYCGFLIFFCFFNRHCNPCGFGLLNYRRVFSAGRFLQSAVASGTSNPQLGGLMIRTFQLPPPGVPQVWNDASEPQQRKVEVWARNCRELCRKWRLPRHFWVILHAVN